MYEKLPGRILHWCFLLLSSLLLLSPHLSLKSKLLCTPKQCWWPLRQFPLPSACLESVCVSLFAQKSTGLTWSSLEITNQRPSLHISPQVTFLGKQCSTYYFFLFRYRMAWPSFQHSTFIYKNLSSFIHRNSLVSVTLFYSPFCALVEKDFSFGERDT